MLLKFSFCYTYLTYSPKLIFQSFNRQLELVRTLAKLELMMWTILIWPIELLLTTFELSLLPLLMVLAQVDSC